MTRTRDLVFLGAPGAGKGTQAASLAVRWKVPHISTGDLFRQHLKDQTPVGLMARGFMDRGLLVPDDVVCTMVRERIEEEDAASGFILDGFPRTVPQAESLDGDLRRMKRGLQAVVSFEIPDALLLDRLTARLTCRSCGAVFNRKLNPPKVAGRCDACGSPDLYTRDDDRPEAVGARLEEYRKKTAPLLEHYGKRGLVLSIDASKPIAEVQTELERKLKDR